jgi:hypothetical protein
MEKPSRCRFFRENATLCVFPNAIVDDGRRRDKMYNAENLANYITFLQKKFDLHLLGNA